MEELDDGHNIDNLLHDAPRDSLLRPDVDETVRPRAPELRRAVVVEVEVPRAGLLLGGPPRPLPWGLRGVLTRQGPLRRSDARAVATV